MKLGESRKNKFWPRIPFKKWIIRGHEKLGYGADNVDETESDLEDFQDFWPCEIERRYSYSATELILGRSISSDGCAGTQPRHSSATLLPKDSEMLRSKFSDLQQFRIFVGTWNVGGRAPNDMLDMDEWLGTLKDPADIYVVGFQEVVPLNAGNVLCSENSASALKWQQLIRQTLNGSIGSSASFRRSCSTQLSMWHDPDLDLSDSFHHDSGGISLASYSSYLNNRSVGRRSLQSQSPYTMVVSKQMVGLFISVWVRSELQQNVRNVKVSCIGCGLMGYLGNKGSISISLCLHQTTFCFVCSHLASGQKNGDEIKRNSDVAEILRRTQFRRSQNTNDTGLPETILEHDRVIWLGDLNYRLTSSSQITRSLLAKEDWDTLLEKDQLQMQRKAGRVFNGWSEGKIYFAPTYKYQTNSDSYVLEKFRLRWKKRTPAWLRFGLTLLVTTEGVIGYFVFLADVEVLSRKKLKDFLMFKPAKVQVEELLPFHNERNFPNF
ncbi:hypothetical protein KP509_1Z123500 [Ceratopteris richardii]|nr:hypothetical protein KP509_1Z123500 [Ceratopteris richardii]